MQLCWKRTELHVRNKNWTIFDDEIKLFTCLCSIKPSHQWVFFVFELERQNLQVNFVILLWRCSWVILRVDAHRNQSGIEPTPEKLHLLQHQSTHHSNSTGSSCIHSGDIQHFCPHNWEWTLRKMETFSICFSCLRKNGKQTIFSEKQ